MHNTLVAYLTPKKKDFTFLCWAEMVKLRMFSMLYKGTGQSLWGTRVRAIKRERKKLWGNRGRGQFFSTNKGGEFIFEKIKPMHNFSQWKKGGQIFVSFCKIQILPTRRVANQPVRGKGISRFQNFHFDDRFYLDTFYNRNSLTLIWKFAHLSLSYFSACAELNLAKKNFVYTSAKTLDVKNRDF